MSMLWRIVTFSKHGASIVIKMWQGLTLW